MTSPQANRRFASAISTHGPGWAGRWTATPTSTARGREHAEDRIRPGPDRGVDRRQVVQPDEEQHERAEPDRRSEAVGAGASERRVEVEHLVVCSCRP